MEAVEVVRVVGASRDADARARAQLPAVDVERRLERPGEPIDEPSDHVAARAVGHEDRELVAAETGDGVALAHAPVKTLGERAEQLVAVQVPERVVDDLELASPLASCALLGTSFPAS